MTRVRRTPEQAQQWYDTLSPWYGVLAAPFERPYREQGLELLDPKAGERIADVGSGTGSALVPIARAVGETGTVVGLDISRGMCAVAQENVESSPVSTRIDVVWGNALSLPFRSGSFDAIFTSFTLELFDTPDIPVVLEECTRVLRSGGRLCVVSLSKRETGHVTRVYERVHLTVPQYVDCRPIYVQQLLADAGFDVEAVQEARMWGLPLELVLATV